MKSLTPAERQLLKGKAHGLNPVVLIGTDGLTAAVLREIDIALKAHELIKVKASGAEREDREAWLVQICSELVAQPVQHIGKTLVIYREAPPKVAAEAAKKPKAGKRKAPARAPTADKPRRPAPRRSPR